MKKWGDKEIKHLTRSSSSGGQDPSVGGVSETYN